MKLKMRVKCIFLILLQCILMTLLSSCGEKNAALDREIKSVKVATVEKSSIQINVEYACRLKPVQEIAVSPKIPGKVATIEADVGQEIKKGQTLFTLDPSDTDAQYQQSKASLDAANANLARTGDSVLTQQIIQAEAAAKQAQVQYDDAKSYDDKIKTLYKNSAASKQQLDDADSKLKNAGIQLNAANESLKLLREKAGPQSVHVASAQVEQAQAAVSLADNQVKNTIIASPLDGIVSAKYIDAGELASNTAPAFIVINASALIAEINVPDAAVVKVKKGQQIEVKVDTLPDRTFTGTIQSVSPAADVRTQLYTVKIKIENTEQKIKAGMFARVKLPQENKEDTLTVPNEAIIVDSGVQYVYAAADGKLVRKIVNAGISNEKITEITTGLSEGEKVVIEGQSFLNDGEKVKIEN